MDDQINGLLIVDKEPGMTSHDVVDFVRRHFGIKKVGHAGTLDPNATGVLVILLGKYTKMSNKYLAEDKEYVAEIKLGEKTDSGDVTGNVVEKKDVLCSIDEIKEAVNSFVGEIEQVPPMVSAKRVNGKRLYELAREGRTIERKPIKIKINKIDFLSADLPKIKLKVSCTKGTYIRQLAEDIGEKLGSGAHLAALRRTKSGSHSLEDAVPFSTLKTMDRNELMRLVIKT